MSFDDDAEDPFEAAATSVSAQMESMQHDISEGWNKVAALRTNIDKLNRQLCDKRALIPHQKRDVLKTRILGDKIEEKMLIDVIEAQALQKSIDRKESLQKMVTDITRKNMFNIVVSETFLEEQEISMTRYAQATRARTEIIFEAKIRDEKAHLDRKRKQSIEFEERTCAAKEETKG